MTHIRKSKILVLIPVKPNMDVRLRTESETLSTKLNKNLFEVVRDDRGPGDQNVSGLIDRVKHTAPIRQNLIDDYLKFYHTHVLWIDADIISYDCDTVESLYETSVREHAIVAPLVLLDKNGVRFYDIAGFIENGRWANLQPPYFISNNILINLDSVGCFYIVPANIYRKGAKHYYNPIYPTDHMGVCQFGKRLGYKILCDSNKRVYHAMLNEYGENLH